MPRFLSLQAPVGAGPLVAIACAAVDLTQTHIAEHTHSGRTFATLTGHHGQAEHRVIL